MVKSTPKYSSYWSCNLNRVFPWLKYWNHKNWYSNFPEAYQRPIYDLVNIYDGVFCGNSYVLIIWSKFPFFSGVFRCLLVTSVIPRCSAALTSGIQLSLKESAKWRACMLACFACFICLVCSRSWRDRVLYVLAYLASFTCSRAWRASWNDVLGVLYKMSCLACFIKCRAWRA